MLYNLNYVIMSEVKKEVKRILDETFSIRTKIKETKDGFKFNINSLDRHDIGILDILSYSGTLLIKRSGTGLVVIIG